jgi:cell division transport system permease protein
MLLINIDNNLNSLGNLNEIAVMVYSDQKYKDDDVITLPSKVESDSNTLVGWSSDPDASEPEYLPGQSYTVNSADAVSDKIVLYAIWKDQPTRSGVTVTFDTFGINITEELSNSSCNVGDTIDLPEILTAKNPTINFLGWALVPSSENGVITSQQYVLSEEDVKGGKVTFYAIWDNMPKYSEFSIIYDSNGVELQSTPSDADIILNHVEVELNKLENIKNIDFISKSDALADEIEKYKDYPGLQQFLSEGNNPLPDTFVITYIDNSQVDLLELQIQNIDGVSKVRCRTDIAQSIENIKSGVIIVFSWFMIILLIVSVFVIINTVKLAVEHRREDIAIMRYIGATKWFVALPFELEGIIIGIFSGISAYLVLWYTYGYVQAMISSEMQMIEVVPFSEIKVLMLFGCLIIGVITGYVGSRISIRKHLNA